MADAYYNSAFKKFMDGDIDLLNDTIKVMLLDTTYAPDVDNDEYVDDISGDEIAGGGYARYALTSPTTTIDAANNRCEFSSDNVDGWNGDTFTGAQYMAIFKDTGNDATSPLICYLDFGGGKDAPFEVNTPANGWFAIGECP